MWIIISTIFLLLSIVVIFMIAARKFPALAALDVENIQSEKEARFKEELISNRLRRDISRSTIYLSRFALFAWKKINHYAKVLYDNLIEMRNEYKTANAENEQDKGKLVKELFEQAEESEKNEDFSIAEKKLIEIIGMDSHNKDAFEQLADLYVDMKNYQDAIETYKHTLRLVDIEDLPRIAELNYSIAFAAKMMEDLQKADKYINRALEIEPNNPRYLDFLLNLSIIIKDKSKALSAYEKMLKVNPGNNKLPEIKEKIDSM